ncbi:MAG TPA: hypothetical protein VIG57_22770 [Candidatus Entotheonella sp.]|jgi:hypothetical protein
MAATGDQETRQARRKARAVPSVSSNNFELTWPYFMYTIVLCFVLTTIVLWVWSMLIPAPLEPIADPNKTPNPSKAPWYFVGLQELLVYFDPWIAGVVLPGLIIGGLMAIPYLDKSSVGIGEYNYKDRKFAFWVFTLGTAFWFILIIIGYFFRGPSWQWYWPWESWEIHKESHVQTHSWSTPVGLLFLVVYGGIGLLLPLAIPYVLGPKAAEGSQLKKICDGLQEFYEKRGPVNYVIQMSLLLMMIGIPVKMILRMFFNVKYILTIPAINLNI